MNFVCNKCKAVSSASAWDKETDKAFADVISFDGDCMGIEAAFEEAELDVYMFACPVCHDKCADPTPLVS